MDNTKIIQSIEKQFKYLDLVKVVKPVDGVILLNPTSDIADFMAGSIGRIVDKTSKGYNVWFPVPGDRSKGLNVHLPSVNLMLYRGVTEQDHVNNWATTPASDPDILSK